MRPKERIPIILELINWQKLWDKWEIDDEWHNKARTNKYYKHIVEEYWNDNPDQRIGQVLINMGIIPDRFDIWIEEDDQILLEQEIDPKEWLLWGVNYDKDHNLLPKTQWKLCKNLETDHIKVILKDVKEEKYKISKLYVKTFNEILDDRKKS